jgi:hypothetical protein
MLRLDRAIRLLMKEDEKSHEAGLEEVERLGEQIRSPDDVRQLLELATREYPYDESLRLGDTTNVDVFKRIPTEAPGYISAVEQMYDSLKGFTHSAVIRQLMDLDSEVGCLAVVRLLSRPCSKTVDLHAPLFIPLRDVPEHGLCMFPGLFELIPHLDNRESIYDVTLAYLQAGTLDLGRHGAFHDLCLERMVWILDDVSRRSADAQMDREALDEYERAYVELEKLLRLGRHWNSRLSAELLHNAVIHESLFRDLPGFDGWMNIVGRPDPMRLRLVAAASLLARNGNVDSALLERLAADRTLRWRLWQELDEVNRLDVFPAKFRTQRALAEAEMVQWLEYPTEMAGPPEEIKFLMSVDYPASVKSKAFFFKFRHPEFEEGQWLVGMAGPYPVAGPPRMGGSKTFSVFETLASKSLVDHVARYLPEEDEIFLPEPEEDD